MLSITDSRGFEAKILADSISAAGDRLTTMEITFPRFILPEFNTHRVFSRNSASSRAIPFWKQLKKISESGYIPSKLGVNQAGMQASTYIFGEKLDEARRLIKLAQDRAVLSTVEMVLGVEKTKEIIGSDYDTAFLSGLSQDDYDVIIEEVRLFEAKVRAAKNDSDIDLGDGLNLHKQHVNRYLEPFMWHKVIVTSTEWGNWDALRISEHAQPEIDAIARMTAYLLAQSTPALLGKGEWHLPLIQDDEKHLVNGDIENWKKISVGRCARVSYETHEGVRDPDKDIALAVVLLEDGHMSPWEHVATPDTENTGLGGNLKGWVQLRKTIAGEADYSTR